MAADKEQGTRRQAWARRVPLQVARATGPGLMVAAILLMVMVVVGNLWPGPERSYVVTARTLFATMTLDGAMTWSFARATVCRPRDQPIRASIEVAEVEPGGCDPRRYEIADAGDAPATESLRLQWRPGDRVEVRTTSEGFMEIRALNGGSGLAASALVIVAMADWRLDGVLPFSGSIRIGSDVASGKPDILLDGRYEARQTDLLSQWTGLRTTVVQEGLLNRGETVRIVERCHPWDKVTEEGGVDPDPCSDPDAEPGGEGRVGERVRPKQSYGHLSPSGPNEDTPAIHVLSVSSRGRPMLELGFFGADRPILIQPNWIESAAASPVLLAAAVLLSFLANAIQLAGPRDRASDAKDVSPPPAQTDLAPSKRTADRLSAPDAGQVASASPAAPASEGNAAQADAMPVEAKELTAEKPADAAPASDPGTAAETTKAPASRRTEALTAAGTSEQGHRQTDIATTGNRVQTVAASAMPDSARLTPRTKADDEP